MLEIFMDFAESRVSLGVCLVQLIWLATLMWWWVSKLCSPCHRWITACLVNKNRAVVCSGLHRGGVYPCPTADQWVLGEKRQHSPVSPLQLWLPSATLISSGLWFIWERWQPGSADVGSPKTYLGVSFFSLDMEMAHMSCFETLPLQGKGLVNILCFCGAI